MMISYKFKYVGGGFLLSGLILAIINQIHRMHLKIPVLAIQSSYIQTKYFTIMRTNIYEEIMMLCFLAGFFLIAFAKEKTELKEYDTLRNSSWRMAIVLNTVMLASSILFIYGKGFIAVILLNMVSVFIFYILVFTIKKTRLKPTGKECDNQH